MLTLAQSVNTLAEWSLVTMDSSQDSGPNTSACIPSLKITASPSQPYTVIHENFIVKQFLFCAKGRKFFT